MKPYYLNEWQAEQVRRWHKSLQPREKGDEQHGPFRLDRGDRARLRRAAVLSDLYPEAAVYMLDEALGTVSPPVERAKPVWLFLLAGAVSRVKESANTSRSLASRLGAGAAPSGRENPFSKLRFERLMRAKEPDDFFRQLCRALPMVSGAIDVGILAEDLVAWTLEHHRPTQSSYSMQYRWARDYYVKQKEVEPANTQGATTETTPATEEEGSN